MEFRKGRILLAGLLLLMLVVLIAVGPFVSLAEPLDTYHQGWSLVRETANEDGANFAAVYDLTGGAGTSNFAGKDSSSVLNGGPFHIRPTGFPVPVSPGSRWQFVICGEARNGADDTFSFDVVGWAAGNGMLQKIVEGDGVLGTQTVVTYPDDGADAVGATVGVTGVTFDLAGGSLAKLFTDTSDTGSFVRAQKYGGSSNFLGPQQATDRCLCSPTGIDLLLCCTVSFSHVLCEKSEPIGGRITRTHRVDGHPI